MNFNTVKLSVCIVVLLVFCNKTLAQNEKNYEENLNNGQIKIKMIAIPGGSFLMGSPATEKLRDADEGPQKKILVAPFFMSATEITHDQFAAFRFEDKDLNPKPDAVSRPTAQYIDLTWGMGKEGGYPANSMQPYTAISFCKWLWKKTGVFYRLPTEAEWEYAAKEGKSLPMPAGVTMQTLKLYAWYTGNSNGAYQKVASKKPNAYGLYDMLGNVAEWTMDMYDPNYFQKLSDSTKSSHFTKRTHYRAYHTAKGGGFSSELKELRPADRQPQTEDWNQRDPQRPRSKWWLTDGDFVGFRVVRPVLQPSSEEAEQFFKDMLEIEP